MSLIYREKEKQKEREDLWGRVENLAMRNPSYEVTLSRTSSMSIILSSNVASPTGDNEDPDITYEKLEAEAREVRIAWILVSVFSIIHCSVVSYCCITI